MTDGAEVILASVKGGVRLRLSDGAWDAEEKALGSFTVTLEARDHRGSLRVYALWASGMVDLFGYLAEHWRGWDGAREWTSLEGDLTLSATSDARGHTFLSVELAPTMDVQPQWRLRSELVLETSQLDVLARDVRTFYYTEPGAG